MLMKMLLSVMKYIPQRIAEKMPPPLLSRDRVQRGRSHPTIAMTLSNLLLCSCPDCPSYPKVRGEALYCSGGRSGVHVREVGCNCVTCRLYDRCSSFNVAYFCIHGHCGARDQRSVAARLKDLAGSYLERFTSWDESHSSNETSVPTMPVMTKSVIMRFDREKDVSTTSGTTILNASLGAGIPHTHVCGGRARCSTCRVLVTNGLENCRPRNEAETRLARIKGFSPDIRLACQTTVTGDVALRRLVLDDTDIRAAIQEGRSDPGDAGHEAEVTVLFCDIRSFTAFAERSLPYDVIHILNRYFEMIGAIIDRHGGYIDKYMGDGIMVVFGLDRSLVEHSSRLAVNAAQDMVGELPEFNEYIKSRFDHEFQVGMGIHTGTVIVGSLGFHKKKEYTSIGDTVNTAARIEEVSKETGTVVLVSDYARQLAGDGFRWGKRISAQVRGKEKTVDLYELIVDRGH